MESKSYHRCAGHLKRLNRRQKKAGGLDRLKYNICGVIMSTIVSSSNTSESAPKPRANYQSAAMRAALLIRCQYSSESKIQYRQECLDHLKASLVLGQETSA